MAKKTGFFGEFKKFIMRGNVIDLAVGVIIGGAFQAIVNSLVDDIIMPLIGVILGKIDFSTLSVKFFDPLDQAKQTVLVEIFYGKFITAVINFLIMAFVIFLIVRSINKVSEKAAARRKAGEPEPDPTTKICPFCKSEIDIEAVKCPHCTSDVE